MPDDQQVRKRKGTSQATKNSNGKSSQLRKRAQSGLICGFNCLLKAAVAVLLFLYVFLPVTFYFSPAFRRHAVFLNFVKWPPNLNLTDLDSFGFNCARHFYIESEKGINLGVWHVVPDSQQSVCQDPTKDMFGDKRPVILYIHGNSGTRGGGHRVDLYKTLASKHTDCHVIAFDYRGYGDSSAVAPTVDGVVQDAKAMYKWLSEQVDPSRIIIWGHSLGTGVTIQLLDTHSDIRASGVILETPFTTLSEVAYHHPLTVLHRHLPYFDFAFIKPAEGKETYFNSEQRVHRLKFPILFLHAEDDGVVPYEHGQRLFRKVKAMRDSSVPEPVFKGFSGKLGYGHKYICRDPGLPKIINDFIESTKKK